MNQVVHRNRLAPRYIGLAVVFLCRVSSEVEVKERKDIIRTI
jgi:hypothetical protein